jgi:hypothetical protein
MSAVLPGLRGPCSFARAGVPKAPVRPAFEAALPSEEPLP